MSKWIFEECAGAKFSGRLYSLSLYPIHGIVSPIARIHKAKMQKVGGDGTTYYYP